MGVRIRVDVFGLNLRLASLMLVVIGKIWFWSSRALTGSVYASSGFIENRSALDVMSRWKYHFKHMEMMITQGFLTRSLLCCNHRDNVTRSWLSDSKRLVAWYPICASYEAYTIQAPGLARDIHYWIAIHNSTVYYAWYRSYIPVRIFLENWVGMVLC